MNRRLYIISIVFGLLVTGCSLLGQGGPGYRSGSGQCAACATTSAPSEPLTAAEAKTLLFMREEEKLAHDVYTALYETWKLNIFRNIPNSEQRHFEAVGFLLTRYELTDPASSRAGVFSNSELQSLYNTLVSQGKKSLTDALQAGVEIEQHDIKDLKDAIGGTAKPDILSVYTNLLGASVRHLEAFQGNLNAQALGR